MDKKNVNPPVGSKRVASVLDVIASPAAASTDVAASKAAASRSASAGALAAPAGASEAAAGGCPALPEWDLYEPVQYICPPNPYDTCMDGPWNELSGSNVGRDEEDEHTKARQVLRRLQVGQYASYFANDVYKCPFCNRRLVDTDFNCLLTHAEDIGRTSPKVGMTVNVQAFHAKHKALGIHLRNFQRVELAAGCMPPINPKVSKIRGQGRKK